MTTHRQPSRRRRFLTPLLALALALAPLGLAAVPADAAARLSVSSALGSGKANATGPTSVQVTGSGLQSIKNAFGGIYVVFGHVENTATWRPSKGGKSGSDYFYVADSQAKNNQGYQRFVAFPGSSTAESANGGVISANGTFKMTMVIPGPTFTAESSSGGSRKIDCREVQCGIFTFGAHGVVNGNNETFTPVSFGTAPATGGTTTEGSGNSSTSQGATSQQAPTTIGGTTNTAQQQNATTGDATTQQGTQQPSTEEAAAGVPQAITNGNPTLGVEQQTVVAGRTLGFAGQGFAPGEQVVATLASGVTAAGPIAAGTFGEVAGAAQIPADLAPGTHKLKLTGAGSGTSVESEFSVMANPATLSAPSDSEQNGVWWALVAVIIAGSILFLLVLSSLIAALVQSKKSPRKKRRSRSRGRAKSKRSGKPSTVGASAPAADHLSPDDDSWFTASVPVEPQDLVYSDDPTAQDSWTVDTDPETSALSELPSPSARERV